VIVNERLGAVCRNRGGNIIEVDMGKRIFDDGDHPPLHGPSIAAVALWGSSKGKRTQLFTDEERAQLSVIASVVRFKKGMQIYREGEPAGAVFNIIDGVVKAYRALPDETERISAFLFADDLLGLAEEAKYVNSAKAVTAVTAYRLPVLALESRLRKDAALEFHVICKLCHDLREVQRHAFLLGRRDALAKVAMFFQLLEHYQAAKGESTNELYLPMSRSDVADYVGMSLEAVSRSFRTLASRGVISFTNKRTIKIEDRAQLEIIASQDDTRGKARHQGRGE
jgi:CRP-like cAMP-binding protein